jgi:hypothetical protein
MAMCGVELSGMLDFLQTYREPVMAAITLGGAPSSSPVMAHGGLSADPILEPKHHSRNQQQHGQFDDGSVRSHLGLRISDFEPK